MKRSFLQGIQNNYAPSQSAIELYCNWQSILKCDLYFPLFIEVYPMPKESTPSHEVEDDKSKVPLRQCSKSYAFYSNKALIASSISPGVDMIFENVRIVKSGNDKAMR